MTIRKFLLTGGPGAGKTESRVVIQKAFEKEGVLALFVPESATELIAGGVSAESLESDQRYQILQIALQLEKEKIFQKAAEWMREKKPVVVILDRGVLDGEAYMDRNAFGKMLEKEGYDRKGLLNRYDAIFHLQSIACLDAQRYSKDNNPARLFDAADAARQDQALWKVYEDHPCHRWIGANENIEEKLTFLAGQMIDCWKELEGGQNSFSDNEKERQ